MEKSEVEKGRSVFKELKDEIVRESHHTITLKKIIKIIFKSGLALRKAIVQKEVSPRKQKKLVSDATNAPRRVIEPARMVALRVSKATQNKRNLQAKFEQ